MTPAKLIAIASIPIILALAIYVSRRSTYDNLKVFAVLIPLQAFATLEAGFTVPPVYLFLVLMIMGALFKGESFKMNPPGARLLMIYMAIAVIATVVAALWLKLPTVQLDEWMRFRGGAIRSPLQLALTVFHLAPFFLVLNAITDHRTADSVIKVHVWMGFALVLLGSYQMVAYVADLPLKDFTWSINAVPESTIYPYAQVHTYGARVADFGTRTTFIETRCFADYLLSVVPISLAFWISGSKEIKERFGVLASPVAAILGVIILFFTMSRSAWVAFAVSAIVMSLWLSPKLLFKHLPVTAVITALVVGLFMKLGFFNESVTSFGSIISERLDTYHILTDPRVTYLLVLYEVVSDNLLLGVGAGNFSYFASSMLGASVLISAHGIPWAALAEFGLLGFLALMSAFAAIMISLGKSIRRTPDRSSKVVMVGIFAALTALLINTFTGGDRPPFHLVFLLGMAAAYASLSRKPGGEERPATSVADEDLM